MPEVLYHRDGPVGIVTLDAPDRRNALVPAMAAELEAACAEIDADDGVGAVVLRATGPTFCAGAHRALLSEVAEDPAETARFDTLDAVYRAFTRVGALSVPVVAAVRGDAVGAGVNLMLAADLCIVAETARVMSGFVHLGLHPGGGHFALLGRAGGRTAAAAAGLFGENLTGAQAAALGLAWQALPAEAVEPRALELAQRAGARPRMARAMVRSFRAELGPPALPWTAALELERGVQMWSLRNRPPAG